MLSTFALFLRNLPSFPTNQPMTPLNTFHLEKPNYSAKPPFSPTTNQDSPGFLFRFFPPPLRSKVKSTTAPIYELLRGHGAHGAGRPGERLRPDGRSDRGPQEGRLDFSRIASARLDSEGSDEVGGICRTFWDEGMVLGLVHLGISLLAWV